MAITATRTTVLRPIAGSDQDGDGFIDAGDILRHTLVLNNTGTNATGVVVNDPLNGSTLLGTVNVSPLALDDSFTAVGNTVLRVGGAANIGSGASSIVAGNLLTNDLGAIGGDGVIGFQLTAVTNGTSAQGGTFNVFSDGSFNYVNQAGDTGTDTFTYTITDAGLDGIYATTADNLTSTGTVTITLSGEVWYVDSAAGPGGTGTSANPFNTIAAFSAANVDGANDFVYVKGAATGTLVMETGEQLVGQGASLDVSGFHLADAGSNSSIANATGTIVTLGSGNTVAGITLGVGTGSATGVSGTNFGTLTIGSSVAIDSGGSALLLNTGAVAGSALTSTNSDGGTNNVSLTTVTGTLALGSGALAGASGAAFNVSGGTVSTDYDGTIAQANFANTVGVSGGHTGTLTFDGNITSTGGEGLYFDNADGTYDFNGVYSANGGLAGVDILNGSGGTFTFDNASNTINHNAGGDAFTIGGTATTANVTWNGNITDNNGNAVTINEHDGGAVTFQNGTIASAGASASGIDVTNSNGGTITFNTQVTLSTQANTAVNLTGNAGGTIAFNPTGTGLDITTTTGTGFNATGGGTVTVADPAGAASNSISAGNGTALNVQNTTIGAADLTFESISSNGGSANGIILETTGALGGLHVTGTAAANSGGTIANKAGADGSASQGTGIYLNDTADVQLNAMSLNTFSNYGIRGLLVNGFQLTNSTVNAGGSNAGFDEGDIGFGVLNSTNGLTGTATITNTTFNGAFEDGLSVFNTSGTLNLTIDNITANTNGGDGILVRGFGTAVMNTEVKNSHFTSNHGDHFDADADVNGTGSATFNVLFGTNGGNTLTGSNADGSLGNSIKIQTGGQWAGSATADVSNNTINFAEDTPININAGGSGTVAVKILSNSIGTTGSANSGSGVNEDAIRLIQNGDKGALGAGANGGTLTALVSGNTLREVGGVGVHVLGRDGGSAGDAIQINVTIQGNTFRDSANSTGQGIYIESGASSTPTPDHVTVWADVGVTGNANSFIGEWAAVTNADGIDYDEIRIRHAITGGNHVILTNYAGGGTDDAAVRAYLNTNNGLDGATLLSGVSRLAGNTWETAATAPPQPLAVAQFAPIELQPYELADQVGLQNDTGPGGGDPPPPADPLPDPTPSVPSAGGPIVVDDGVLSAAELALIVDAAIDRWAAAGASVEQLAAMRATSVTVENLAGLNIGLSYSGRVVVDDNAGGFNWFIDSTPGDDSEYAGGGTRLSAAAHTQAGDRVDLLTTVMHELGHQIGLGDIYIATGQAELMYGTIFIGERRLPGSDDAGGGDGAAATGSPLALTPINLGTIPAGKSVTLQWDSTVDAFAAGFVPTYTNTSVVTGSNPGAFTVNSNTETLSGSSAPLAFDSLTLGGTVWNDNGAGGGIAGNGIKDGTEAGVFAVAVTLFVDNGTSAGVWDASDVMVGPTSTNPSGAYNFGLLAPGDYIVRVDLDNFDAGGNVSLLGLQSSSTTAPEPIDPDNDVDNDDNGARAAGAAAYSAAITLAQNSEPTADGSGKFDINTTLDFAFRAAHLEPTLGATGLNPTYTEDAAAVDLFGGVVASTVDAGQSFTSLTLTVSNVTDGAAEVLSFDGSNVALTNGNAVTTATNGLGVTVSVAAGLATVTFSGAALSNAALGTLVDGLTYRNTSQSPTDANRVVTITQLVDSGNGTAPDDNTLAPVALTSTVNVNPVDDSPVAQPDAVTTAENAIGTGSVFASNGSGADADVDGPALTVSAVNGVGGNVGTPITLASGAKLTLNADGSYSYDPNGKFNYLVSTATAGTTGAVNDTATDSFTYTLTGGNTVTVTMTVTGVDGAGDQLWGNAGSNTIVGTPAGDLFNLSQGGDDTATGLGGNDGFYLGAALSAGDSLDGGAGLLDQLGLQGNYGSPFVLGANTLVNIEMLVLLPGNDTRFGDTAGNLYSYNLATVDANVAAGERLIVSFNQLRAGENVTFDGSAETNGQFLTFAGLGNDAITGGAQDDGFYFGNSGRWGAGDSVTGGAGSDQLGLQGNYSGAGAVTFGASQISGIEMLVLLTGGDARFGNPPGTGYSYDVTMHDGNVAAGEMFYVSANTLRANVSGVTDETLTFNGSAESNGHFTIYSGAAADTLVGGLLADTIYGGDGADTMTGGGGNDTFAYINAAHSTATAMDQILDFATGDQIDLAAIDAITGGANDAFSFIGSGAFSNTAGELRAFDAGGGVWQVQGDIDGNGSADLIIAVTTGVPLAITDFVL